MSTTETMRKAARAAIERPLPMPQAAAPEILEALEAIRIRLDREPVSPPQDGKALEVLATIKAQLARQGEATAELRAMVDTLTARQEMTPPAAAACEAAAARMAKAADQVSSGASLLQEVARHFREAAAEVLDWREGRGRRLAAGLMLAAALPSVVGTVWLAWRANLL